MVFATKLAVPCLLGSALAKGHRQWSVCDSGPITPKTWNQRNIDSYLKNGTAIRAITIDKYALSQGASDFHCGIGEECLAGQICSPVKAPAWHILMATQEWNFHVNRMYQNMAFAMDMVKGTIASVVSDLTPPDTVAEQVMRSEVLSGLLVAVLVPWVFIPSAGQGLIWGMTLGGTGAVLTLHEFSGLFSSRPERHEMVTLSSVVYALSEWELSAHQKLSDTVRRILKTPVGAPGGLGDILAHGKFFSNHPMLPAQNSLEGHRQVLQARALIAVLRTKNAFITRGEGVCHGKGLHGAEIGSDKLSWCDGSGMMMRIVIAKKNKVKTKIYGAYLIASKYGYSTELLTTQSWSCQQKYGMGGDPYKTGKTPMSIHDDCVINLPVCDCTKPDLGQMVKKKGLVPACRGLGYLPI